jgi:hypothetical protein
MPTMSAFIRSLPEKFTKTSLAPSTTWKFVITWPSLSMTKPEPRAWPSCENGSCDWMLEVTWTTPGAALR